MKTKTFKFNIGNGVSYSIKFFLNKHNQIEDVTTTRHPQNYDLSFKQFNKETKNIDYIALKKQCLKPMMI